MALDDSKNPPQPVAPLPTPTLSASPRPRSGFRAIELSLGGKLPCISCGYDLQGISILGVCPECGTNVRATVLAAVDPMAEELVPLRAPTLLAGGMVMWSVGGLLALLAAWWQIGPELPGLIGLPLRSIAVASLQPVQVLLAFGLVMSMVGAVAMVDPHEGTKPSVKLAAIVGVVLYMPAIAAVLLAPDLAASSRLSTGYGGLTLWTPAPERTLWRLLAWACIFVMLMCLRPAARTMVARSVLLRTGRVDRQTLVAMAAAVGLLMLGDVLAMLAVATSATYDQAAAAWLYIAGVVLWAMGGVLMTFGVVGSVIDCVRIARAILNPSPSLRQVMGQPPAPKSRIISGSGEVPGTQSILQDRSSHD